MKIPVVALALVLAAAPAAADLCGGVPFEARVAAYERANPAMRTVVQRQLAWPEAYVGMPEALFLAFACGQVAEVHTTAVAGGETKQLVMEDLNIFRARYVYLRGGKVSGVQR